MNINKEELTLSTPSVIISILNLIASVAMYSWALVIIVTQGQLLVDDPGICLGQTANLLQIVFVAIEVGISVLIVVNLVTSIHCASTWRLRTATLGVTGVSQIILALVNIIFLVSLSVLVMDSACGIEFPEWYQMIYTWLITYWALVGIFIVCQSITVLLTQCVPIRPIYSKNQYYTPISENA